MGQANSKQDTGAVSDENRLVYPIGGGHVGEGPVYVNPIAEGSQQQQLPSAQEKPGQLQSEAGSAAPASSAESHSKEFPASGKQAMCSCCACQTYFLADRAILSIGLLLPWRILGIIAS